MLMMPSKRMTLLNFFCNRLVLDMSNVQIFKEIGRILQKYRGWLIPPAIFNTKKRTSNRVNGILKIY